MNATANRLQISGLSWAVTGWAVNDLAARDLTQPDRNVDTPTKMSAFWNRVNFGTLAAAAISMSADATVPRNTNRSKDG
ncbi:hypothetical protein FRC06_005870, partial [Ceratobasidium sp. 370]